MSGLQRRLRVFAAASMLSLAVLSLLSLADMRRHAIEDAQAQMSNLSQSLADQAHDTLLTLDTVLVGLRERVETDGLQPEAQQRLNKLLALRAAALGLVHRISVLDLSGRIVASSDRTADPTTAASGAQRSKLFDFIRTRLAWARWSAGRYATGRTGNGC